MDRFSVNARLSALKAAEAAALKRGDHDAAKRVRAFFHTCSANNVQFNGVKC